MPKPPAEVHHNISGLSVPEESPKLREALQLMIETVNKSPLPSITSYQKFTKEAHHSVTNEAGKTTDITGLTNLKPSMLSEEGVIGDYEFKHKDKTFCMTIREDHTCGEKYDLASVPEHQTMGSRDDIEGVIAGYTAGVEDEKYISNQTIKKYRLILRPVMITPSLSIKSPRILYFGDFDPSGQDIERNIRDKLQNTFGVPVIVDRIALTREQIDKFQLPPQPAKKSDSRYEEFVKNHGDLAVELDAIPPEDLRELIRDSVNQYFDYEYYEENVLPEQETRQEKLREMVEETIQ